MQDIIVYIIVALAVGSVIWRLVRSFISTDKASDCHDGCAGCSGCGAAQKLSKEKPFHLDKQA